jgi:hypothetical protein
VRRSAPPAAPGWETSEREEAGAVESRQRIRLTRPIVEPDEAGARELGRRYLEEVGRVTHGLVRPRREPRGVALVLAGAVPLLRFGPPELGTGGSSVECTFPIRGGLLAARPGGSLVVAQRFAGDPALELAVAGYFPRLGGSSRRRSLRRLLYSAVQARIHRAVSRRFLERAAGAS